MTTTIPVLDPLAFHAQLGRLANREHDAQAEFLFWLAEFDRRDVYLALGYSSLWAYLLDGLHFDEGQVNLRTRVVHLIQRFPMLVEPLRDRRLSMSTLVMLGPLMTEANAADLVERASYKSKSDVEKLIVSIRPIEVKQEGFRALNQPSAPAPVPAVAEDLAPVPAPLPPPRPLQPVADNLALFRAKLSNHTVESLKRCAELASHRIKPGDWDGLLGEMARVFCQHELKRIAAQTERPKKESRAPKGNRHISAAVRRVVWQRDDGRCTFVGPAGRRCNSRWRVQYHHVQAAGRGGPATADNIHLRCANHNQYEADVEYGKDFMDTKRNPTIPGSGDASFGQSTDHSDHQARSSRCRQDASSQPSATEDLQSQLGFSGTQ